MLQVKSQSYSTEHYKNEKQLSFTECGVCVKRKLQQIVEHTVEKRESEGNIHSTQTHTEGLQHCY